MSHRYGFVSLCVLIFLTGACAVEVSDNIALTVAPPAADGAVDELTAVVEEVVIEDAVIDVVEAVPSEQTSQTTPLDALASSAAPAPPTDLAEDESLQPDLSLVGSMCRPWDDDLGLSIWTFELPNAATTLIGDVNQHGAVAAYTGSIPDGHAAYLVRPDGSIEPIEIEGSESTVPWVMNDSEMVAGAYWPSSSEAAGFIRSPDGSIEKFAMPERARFVDVAGANERGDIFGSYSDSAGLTQWYTRTADGAVTKVQIAGAERVRLLSIDETGSLIGTYRDIETWADVAFVRSTAGQVIELELPDGWDGRIQAANDHGDMVIHIAGSPSLTEGGQIEAIEIPGLSGVPLGVVKLTESGTIAGYFRNADSNQQSVIRRADGTSFTIDVAGSSRTRLEAARDDVYAGSWQPEGSYEDAFVILPTTICAN